MKKSSLIHCVSSPLKHPNKQEPVNKCHVDVYHRQRDLPFSIPVDSVEAVVCSVLEHENVSADFVSIYFISDRVMRQYHKKYFQDPSPTDCISFPVDSEADSHGPRVLGDVFVCPKTAHLYVQGDERKFWEELTLYIVHGLLHLLGYEDMPASARSKMRAREKIIISALKKGQKMISGTFS